MNHLSCCRGIGAADLAITLPLPADEYLHECENFGEQTVRSGRDEHASRVDRLDAAIAHNLYVMARHEPGLGLSIERETRLLQPIAAITTSIPQAA